MHIAIDATMIAPGGGLTGLRSYVGQWVKLVEVEKISVFASRTSVVNSLNFGNKCETIPVLIGQSSGAVFAYRQLIMPSVLNRIGPDVVFTTNSQIRMCRIPQLVHQRNLKHFDDGSGIDLIRSPFVAIREIVRNNEARHAAKHAQANVFVSEYLKVKASEVIRNPHGKWSVIPNGVAKSNFSDTELLSSRRLPRIIAITADSRHKDNSMLIDILASLRTEMRSIDWQLHVAGLGDYTVEKMRAKELGVSGSISWLGFQSRIQLEELLKSSFAMVFPSRLESFGNPPLEAMSMGCPVIATNCTAIPEVVGSAGILCDVGNLDQFVSSIVQLWKDESHYKALQRNGLLRSSSFDWERNSLEMLKVLASIQK